MARRARRRSALRIAAAAALSLSGAAIFLLPGPVPPAPASLFAIVRFLGLLVAVLCAWLCVRGILATIADRSGDEPQ